jgi:hypothetical protein
MPEEARTPRVERMLGTARTPLAEKTPGGARMPCESWGVASRSPRQDIGASPALFGRKRTKQPLADYQNLTRAPTPELVDGTHDLLVLLLAAKSNGNELLVGLISRPSSRALMKGMGLQDMQIRRRPGEPERSRAALAISAPRGRSDRDLSREMSASAPPVRSPACGLVARASARRLADLRLVSRAPQGTFERCGAQGLKGAAGRATRYPEESADG